MMQIHEMKTEVLKAPIFASIENKEGEEQPEDFEWIESPELITGLGCGG